MKKTFAIFIVFAIIFLYACTSSQPTNDDTDLIATTVESMIKEESSIEPEPVTAPRVSLFGTGHIDLETQIWTGTFDEEFQYNPIDYAFALTREEVLTIGAMIQTSYRFRNYWQAEIDNVVIRLSERLGEYSTVEMLNAQQAWEEYIEHNLQFRRSLLSHLGSAYRVIINNIWLEETRARAIELMDFYYRLTGEVVFVFEE